jgi:hypothetical protein
VGGAATGPGDGAQLGQDRRLAGQLSAGRRGRRRRQQFGHLGIAGWRLVGGQLTGKQPLDGFVLEGQRVGVRIEG